MLRTRLDAARAVMNGSYAQAFAALPAAWRAQRAEAFARFERQGFPDSRLEDWRYTDVSALAGATFGEAPELAPASVESIDGAQLQRFVNGRGLDRSGGGTLPATLADDGVTALNAALWRDGAELDLPAGTPHRYHLHCAFGGSSAPAMAHLRHRIRLRRGAEALIFLELQSDASELLTTQVAEIELEAGAQLTLVRLQALGERTTDLSRTELKLQRDARLRYVGLDLGGALARHDLNVQLTEPGAEVQLHGVFAPGRQTHADTHTRIVHAAPHTTSRELYRGLVLDRARAVFNGRIVVQPGAQKTDSEQNVGALLLSPRAELNAKPELEIYADDVKCAHGSTCGQLDEEAVYYLRTRGLDLESARKLLTYTFAHQALAALADEALRRRLDRALLGQLPGGHGLRELL